MSDTSDSETDGNYFNGDGEALDRALPFIDRKSWPDDIEPLDYDLAQLPENDLANAKRLLLRNDGRIFWTREWGEGVWDGRRFDFEHGKAMAGLLAQDTAERMLTHEAPAFYELGKRKGESTDDFMKRAGRFFGWALIAGNNGKTEAMLKQAERRLTRPLADFDADPDMLTLANGTLLLPRDGRAPVFIPAHDPARLSSKVAGAAFDPRAQAPQFEAFLEHVMPDPLDRAFLARIIGYCLTGQIGEQAYFIFQGKGGDGKSTFLEAVAAALGDYVANAAIETFLHREKKGSDHSADVARLASGVRLVKAAEPEQGARLAEAVLKIVTGGEPFPARAMFKEPFEFVARWKLIISCNRKPQIRGGDRGIWRRTLVLPWPVSIPKDEMDKALPDKLRAEAPGILNWALRGWADWLELGDLKPPPNVIAAVEEYKLTSDPCAVWFDTCCDLDNGFEDSAKRLFESYQGWAKGSGFDAMTKTAFGRWLSERGLKRRHSNGIQWGGVCLNSAGVAAWNEHDSGIADPQPGRFGPVAGDDED